MATNSSIIESSSATSSSQMEDQSWISWFCGMKDNHFFCRIEKAYIEDSFNLYGLKQYFPDEYNDAMDVILDRSLESLDDASGDPANRVAESLYGLIHARYILSGPGLLAMHKKYLAKEFGECPRTCCNGQGALPVGISDEPGLTSVKIFCPKCRDIYNPSAGLKHVDGAYFGTAFPHMFLMTFENLVPYAPTHQYVPRIFGFKLHNSNVCIPKVPPADLSLLSLPSLERREMNQPNNPNMKSQSSKTGQTNDDASSVFTVEENTPQASHIAADKIEIRDPSITKSKVTGGQDTSSNPSTINNNKAIENSSKKRSSQPSTNSHSANSASNQMKSDEPANKKIKKS